MCHVPIFYTSRVCAVCNNSNLDFNISHMSYSELKKWKKSKQTCFRHVLKLRNADNLHLF